MSPIACPTCQQSDLVRKVSAVYIEGLGASPERRAIPRSAARRLSQRLAPPSGGKREVMRLIHPDWMAGALALILPFFLTGIYTTQNGFFWPALAFVALVAGLYAWQHGRLVQRYQHSQRARQEDAARVEKAIQAWMRLYYCARDEVVFDPLVGDPIPIDEMNYHLLHA